MFSDVYPEFHKRFPEITVAPNELSVRKQQALIAKGDLDMGFMTLCEKHKTDDVYIPMSPEEIYLAIPSRHPLSSLAPENGIAVLDISEVRMNPLY